MANTENTKLAQEIHTRLDTIVQNLISAHQKNLPTSDSFSTQLNTQAHLAMEIVRQMIESTPLQAAKTHFAETAIRRSPVKVADQQSQSDFNSIITAADQIVSHMDTGEPDDDSTAMDVLGIEEPAEPERKPSVLKKMLNHLTKARPKSRNAFDIAAKDIDATNRPASPTAESKPDQSPLKQHLITVKPVEFDTHDNPMPSKSPGKLFDEVAETRLPKKSLSSTKDLDALPNLESGVNTASTSARISMQMGNNPMSQLANIMRKSNRTSLVDTGVTSASIDEAIQTQRLGSSSHLKANSDILPPILVPRRSKEDQEPRTPIATDNPASLQVGDLLPPPLVPRRSRGDAERPITIATENPASFGVF